MKRLELTLLLGWLLTALVAPAQIKILPVVLHWQENENWCWATAGEMLMEYLGGTNPREVPQCYQVNQFLGRSDCCTCPTPGACISPGWPQFSTWNFNSSQTSWGTPLSWPAVMGQIDGNKPFFFTLDYNGGGANPFVAKGYLNFNFLGMSWNWIWVETTMPTALRCDPAGNASGPFGGDTEIFTFAEFVGGPGYDYTHGSDIYDITYK